MVDADANQYCYCSMLNKYRNYFRICETVIVSATQPEIFTKVVQFL